MLNAVNNYNNLGKLGPHYDRPEYRPSAAGAEDRRRPDGTKSERPQIAAAAEKKTSAPSARLSLDAARRLIEDLAAQIGSLPPHSTDREPHARLKASLLSPIYA